MKRSKFSLSNYKLLSCDMGELVPVGLQEVLPGDTFQQVSHALVRLSPLLAPMMHPVHVRIHHWFVPHRLVWEDWEDFITGGPDGDDNSVFPTHLFDPGPVVGSLADYLGLPAKAVAGNPITTSVLPFRGYALIWNEWYRDQDLQDPVAVSKESGNDTTTSITMQNVSWEKDYFTTARPWAQKGPDVVIPMSGQAPVSGFGVVDAQPNSGATGALMETGMATSYAQSASAGFRVKLDNAGAVGVTNRPRVFADLENSSVGIDVNDLRRSLALQRFEEARARYGSRYVEYLRYLGVRSSDARLQRPEYLGGGRQTLQISEVLQTAPTTDGDDEVGVGNLKGHGIGALRTNRYRRFFEEHGYIFSLLSVKPRTMYSQGLPRTWNRRFREDFYQKEFVHIGQQEILNKELYAESATPDGTFGWQDRYDEYRRTESTIAGEFRTTELDFWHMARIFGSEPTLNADFIKSVPTKRNFAVQSEDVLWIMCQHSIQARRMLPPVGTSFTF